MHTGTNQNRPNSTVLVSESSKQSPRGQSAMPTTDKVTPIRGDDLTLVDNKQAADIIGVHYLTLQNWRSTGKSPKFIKVGRSVRYRLSDLKAWLEAKTRNHTGEVV